MRGHIDSAQGNQDDEQCVRPEGVDDPGRSERRERAQQQDRRGEPPHHRGVDAGIEQGERQGAAHDRADPDAGAVEHQRQRDQRRMAGEQADTGADQERRGECRPERMKPPTDQHFQNPPADLARPDQGTEPHRRRERNLARLQHGEQMHGKHRGGDAADGQAGGEQCEDEPIAFRQGDPRSAAFTPAQQRGQDLPPPAGTGGGAPDHRARNAARRRHAAAD